MGKLIKWTLLYSKKKMRDVKYTQRDSREKLVCQFDSDLLLENHLQMHYLQFPLRPAFDFVKTLGSREFT